jgi:hypothetical protein
MRFLDPGDYGLSRLLGYLELHQLVRPARKTMARGRMPLPYAMSQTGRLTKSQPRSLLSMTRLNSAKSRALSAS